MSSSRCDQSGFLSFKFYLPHVNAIEPQSPVRGDRAPTQRAGVAAGYLPYSHTRCGRRPFGDHLGWPDRRKPVTPLIAYAGACAVMRNRQKKNRRIASPAGKAKTGPCAFPPKECPAERRLRIDEEQSKRSPPIRAGIQGTNAVAAPFVTPRRTQCQDRQYAGIWQTKTCRDRAGNPSRSGLCSRG